MIRINLLGEEKDYTAYYVVQGFFTVCSLAATLVVCFLLLTAVGNEKTDLESREANLNRQKSRLATKTKEVDGLNDKKKLLGDKLSTIAELKALKQSPVLVLDALTRLIPERVWVNSVTKRANSMELKGTALDNQTISVFIKELADSPFYQAMDLVFSKQITKEGVELKEFSLNGKLEDALKTNKIVLDQQNGLAVSAEVLGEEALNKEQS